MSSALTITITTVVLRCYIIIIIIIKKIMVSFPSASDQSVVSARFTES